MEGRNVLIPRAIKGREILPETLRGAGAQVSIAPVYKNVPPKGRKEELREELEAGKVDMVTFTSSSTVRNFLMMVDAKDQEELKQLLDGVKIAALRREGRCDGYLLFTNRRLPASATGTNTTSAV